MQRKLLAAALFALFAFFHGDPSFAQSTSPVVLPGGCGTGSFPSGSPSYPTMDSTGRLCDSGGSPSPSSAIGLPPIFSTATEASHVMCSATCNLYGFQVNTTSAPVWVMAFDATSLPVNGAVTPKKWWQVAINSTLGASWAGGPPLNLSTGLVLGCSTTGPFTLTASATCDFSAEVKQ